ncbi:MAG: ribonuclease catalytic domain-containing protein [Clostridia bacterium]|jgi:exoribonuclease-2
MIPTGAIVFFKGKPAISTRDGDRLVLDIQGSQSARVRDKDVELIHPGPYQKLPAPAGAGDFETAWEMTAGTEVGLAELAELVFGVDGAAERLACRQAAMDGELFRMEGTRIMALNAEERDRLADRRLKKETEASDRAAFIARAKKANLEPGDERFWGEVEAFALGKTQKSKMAVDIGLGESMESAHAWLLRAGLWTPGINPHPSRADHPSKAPELELGDDDDSGRIDLSAMQAWAIDNAWSHDPDDAISWDGKAVWVHVADPASVICPGSRADIEASDRSATLYLPEGTIPMLPDAALDRFGLGLSERSRALSIRIAVDEAGLISDVAISPSFVRVTRLSYAEADTALESGPLAELAGLAVIRSAYRHKAGAVDINIPEVRVWVRDGVPHIDSIPDFRSSSVVREMMVLAGEAVARWAFDRSLPFPYYSQEAPGSRDELPVGLAGEFAKRRLMRAGMAGAQPRAHQGLGVTMYAQSTSPLRRYGDLLGHQQIRAWLAKEAGRQASPPLPADELSMRLAKAAAALSAVRKAERSSQAHWTLVWLLEHPDWTGEGIVVQTGQDTVFYIPSLGYETRIKGGELGLNQSVSLRCLKVDLPRLEAFFALA